MLFDCIEFNEPFRFADVMYDVAFTVMDIEARGRKDLGNAFLNAYVEETGDWEGLQVLPLYLSRQAYVRAKVNSFLLDCYCNFCALIIINYFFKDLFYILCKRVYLSVF